MASRRANHYRRKKGTGGRKTPSKSRRSRSTNGKKRSSSSSGKSSSSAYYRGLKDGTKNALLSMMADARKESKYYRKKGDAAYDKDPEMGRIYWKDASEYSAIVNYLYRQLHKKGFVKYESVTAGIKRRRK